jgi:pyruvate kinase
VLAAETAIGKYPVEAIRMVRQLIDESTSWMQDASISEILKA